MTGKLVVLLDGKKIGEAKDLGGALQVAKLWSQAHMDESENGTLTEAMEVEIAVVIGSGTLEPKADGKRQVNTEVRLV